MYNNENNILYKMRKLTFVQDKMKILFMYVNENNPSFYVHLWKIILFVQDEKKPTKQHFIVTNR